METMLLSVIAVLLSVLGGGGMYLVRDIKDDVKQLRNGMGDLRAGVNDALHGINEVLRLHGERISAAEARGDARDKRIDDVGGKGL